jgi:hypothetical protein
MAKVPEKILYKYLSGVLDVRQTGLPEQVRVTAKRG